MKRDLKGRRLLQEYEENGHYKAHKGGEVVPVKALSFEEKRYYNGEYH